jgi:hypothetical protein
MARVAGVATILLIAAPAVWDSDPSLVLYAAIFCLPYLVFTLMRTSEKWQAWGRLFAWLGLVTSVVGACLALFWRSDWRIPVYLLTIGAVQVAQLVLLRHAHSGEVKSRGPRILGGVYAALVAGFVILTLPTSFGGGSERLHYNEMSAVGSLRSINSAATLYLNNYQKLGYPRDLHAMGRAASPGKEDEHAAGILEANLACAQSRCVKAGYSFEYQVEVKDGVAIHYRAHARPLTFEKTGIASFYTSDDGVIHRTSENRAATANDPPQ